MLPILPALILLLLQGPASIERMALEGKLPAALMALQSRIEAPHSRPRLRTTRSEAVAMASLLAASSHPELAKALLVLLSVPPEPDPVRRTTTAPEEPAPPPPCPAGLGELQSGFLKLQRSRDGPLSR